MAGALHFARYDYFKRVVLKWIAGRTGLEVDETKAIEYTDWGQLTV